jgi:hypothetical protein
MGDGGFVRRIRIFAAAFLALTGLFVFSSCGAASDKAQDAADYAKDAVGKAAEFAGEVTANWLGTTAATVGKSYNKSVVERLKNLKITVDKVDFKTAEGQKDYTIVLTLDNSAPDNEKMYVSVLLDDNYLIACDKNDYVYSLSPRGTEVADYDYNNMIMPGKNRLTVYTSIPETEEISHLLFIENELRLP